MPDHRVTPDRPQRRNTETKRQPIPPVTVVGRGTYTWHIIEGGRPLCGRVTEADIRLTTTLAGLTDPRLCRCCTHELSWRPSPEEHVKEDRGYETPCLIWRRSLDAYGYGKRGRRGRWTFAHRDAYEAEYGEIPEGFVVHHKCDQKDCLRPDHLEAITRAEHVRLHRAGRPFIGGRKRG